MATTWAPDFLEMLEEAYEQAGLEMRTGHDVKTGIRTFNLLMAEWANKGLNLWSLDHETIALSEGTGRYGLPTDTIDIIEHSIREGSGTTQTDTKMERISVSQYAQISSKNLEGRPTRVFVERLVDRPYANVWPVPDQAYTMSYWRLRRSGDAGLHSGDTRPELDLPHRFWPALAAGMAYRLCMKKGGPERMPMLKAEYVELFNEAADEDRDRSSFFVSPYVG